MARAYPLDVGLLQLSVPGYSLYSPLISELYYSITHGGHRDYYNHSAPKNTSSMNQPERCYPLARRIVCIS